MRAAQQRRYDSLEDFSCNFYINGEREMIKLNRAALIAALLVGVVASKSQAAVPDKLAGTIKIDGSSTVYPITEAVAEEFGQKNPGVRITVGISGTGGGFKKFIAGETDISDASRPIKASEVEQLKVNKIDYIELPIAHDALTIVVNTQNTWATSMTVAELKKLWEPEAQGKITRWNQIRAEWPNEPIKLFGAGTDSGTFDYFTEAIVGKEKASRGDYTASEDDNVLVQGVASDKYALGYFGMAYYQENKAKLKAVSIDDGKDANGKGAIAPSSETVLASTYQPLSRPLFIYVRKDAADRPEVREFVSFYLQNGTSLTKEVGYVPLSENIYKVALGRFNDRITGSLFQTGSEVGVSLETIYNNKKG